MRFEFAPDHRTDHIVRRKIGQRARFDGLAVAQDGDPVGDSRQFFQAVRNINDAGAASS